MNIVITVKVKTIYKTGVEVEGMQGASITALTICDMLKPIDQSVEIGFSENCRKWYCKINHVIKKK